MIVQVAGLLTLLLFYGCYITKVLKQRRQGIQTDQMGKGKTGSARIIELTMKGAAYLAFVTVAVSIARNTSAFSMPVRVAGVAAAAAGTALFTVSVATMRDSWRAGVSMSEQTELVTGGIYQFSRNPAFLGFDLLYLGLAAAFFNWVLLAAAVFAVIMFHLQIVYVEEVFLTERFGAQYTAYQRRVCRYLGRKPDRRKGG